jgi:hypothetical protein
VIFSTTYDPVLTSISLFIFTYLVFADSGEGQGKVALIGLGLKRGLRIGSISLSIFIYFCFFGWSPTDFVRPDDNVVSKIKKMKKLSRKK